ncbi:MAG TPA: gas vesicle protein [Myxococcales bacterium]|jgi:hypothetical protein|nr:gas vesicle protein [Myxococcales bacterium]
MPASERNLGEHVSLVEILDRVLGKGAVIAGEVVIAVADIDLVRLELQVALGTSDALAPTGEAPASEARRR